ncbi:hypothetical protein HYFRA_00001402 [Hymenoscyphus fraxineus]|uniref:HTH araC/xylS-type domain-containing protein n=1 Tax=Hymenoscyphus fraxineus TaxID=746836 RepID=A0A9N9L7L5_9HELO|nr:hypothetical protein HYFRA_00001402 [Hymenoscyphus fraxineus]
MPHFSSPTSRWSALQSRNPLAANAFIYAVTTTKIYCRPTCPSRLARKANIKFYDSANEAEAAGYRACKRCRPELKEIDGDPQKVFVDRACELIRNEGDGEKWGVKGLAKEVGLTESHFCRVFKKVAGLTVGEYRSSLCRRMENQVDQSAEGGGQLSNMDLGSFQSLDFLWELGDGEEGLTASNIDHGGLFEFFEPRFLEYGSGIVGGPDLEHTVDENLSTDFF